uniref:CREB-regulated transcription coactivator 1-like n=1 Tax=Sinocyclocheilus rhinocerous TaxID=307959 RepID=A0A673JIE3_9TELE
VGLFLFFITFSFGCVCVSAGLLPSLLGTSSNPSLQSSLSNPNIQSSLSAHSFHNLLSSASLHSSLSNPSLQSSLSSSPSLRSSLSSQSLQSWLSNSSLSGSSSALQPQTSSSPRRRAQLTPVILPADTRRHHPKQFSPTSSSLSSITQGVALDTSRLQVDQRSSPYSFAQQQQVQKGLGLHLHNMQNLPMKRSSPGQNQNPSPVSYRPADASQTLPPLQQISPALSGDLDLYSLSVDSQLEAVNHDGGSAVVLKAQSGSYQGQPAPMELLDSSEQQMINQNQSQSYTDGRHPVPNIILTGDSSGLSKEITSALSCVPGFEMDPFSSDNPLALGGLGMLTDGDLMLADPAVEDSFRSDHLK